MKTKPISSQSLLLLLTAIGLALFIYASTPWSSCPGT